MLWVPSEPHALNKLKLVVLIKESHLKRSLGNIAIQALEQEENAI